MINFLNHKIDIMNFKNILGFIILLAGMTFSMVFFSGYFLFTVLFMTIGMNLFLTDYKDKS